MRSLIRVKALFRIQLIILGILFYVYGCSNESPILQSIEETALIVNQNEKQYLEQSDIGLIKILEVDSSILEDNLIDTLFSVETLIQANSGGEVKVGNDTIGYFMLKIKSGDLNNDSSIRAQWEIIDGKYEIEFGPDGLRFNQPVEFKILYKAAKLTGVDENTLNLFLYNPDMNIWESLGGKADKINKMFRGEITHFSRYALAHAQ